MAKFKLMLIAVLYLFAQAIMAQGHRISGNVSDNMEPIMMANVVERDANNRIVSASITDINGNFSMMIINPKNKLSVSYVGYQSVIIPIGARTSFKIVMQPLGTTIKEITVQSKRRSNSSGLLIPKREVSVAQQTFDMAKVEGLSFTSADEALQGKIAGLDIVANSGNLGAGTTMRLRGVTTINGNAEPLIVVDDKIMDNPDATFDFSNATEESYASLLSVNVEDIASITVLKDAAATAIWGVNGANGVIEITTKRGSHGKTRVNYSYIFTGSWQPAGYKLLNGDDYTMLMKEEFYNPSQSSTVTTNIEELNYDQSWSDYENWNNNTDWVKAVTQFGQSHSHNINLSGGGTKANFRISAGYDHQTGSVIKQTLDRFSTRLVLDYFVSERIKFSTNFALTYTDNNKNYSSLLGIAQKLAPNMSIYRQTGDGTNTNEYYVMSPSGDATTGNYSSSSLSAIRDLGNPVAIANLAWSKEKTYRITPDFSLSYELLGKDEDKSRLTYTGRVNFDIYANSSPTYYPASLEAQTWTSNDSYNVSTNTESNRVQFELTHDLVYTPHFKNEDWTSTMRLRYHMSSSKSNGQTITTGELPNGITATTVNADLQSMSSSTSRSQSQDYSWSGHLSYKSRYSITASVRGDGSTKFGPKNKWAFFPGISGRWNISDEPWMKWCRKTISMLAFRPSWGMVGNAPTAESLFYSVYDTSDGYYGSGNTMLTVGSIDGLKLDNLKWEKTKSYNLGFNLGLFNDNIEVEFEYYHKNTTNLLMKSVRIPSTSGYTSLSYANVGSMMNEGWEVNFEANNIIHAGKFSMSADFNVSQDRNRIIEMDDRVLESINSSWSASSLGTYLNRIQVGNPLGSIYGLRYKGVYQYTYEYLTNYAKEQGFTNAQFEDWINNTFLSSGKTAPIALDSKGKVLMSSTGTPIRMIYNHSGLDYQFQGGDAIYEDVNHDGEINSLDVVYLGNSLPKVSGGFNLSFRYGKWSLRSSFHYRFGAKVVNLARMSLEKMYTTNNQCATVNWRWRKDGDVTPMPRAMYNCAYNWLGSDRYVEDGSFIRFQYLQLTYSFPQKIIKKAGLSDLKFYASANNLYCWTKYSGTDPEHSAGSWGIATDESQTPRSKSFTVGVNLSF